MNERGRWRVNETTGEVEIVRGASDYLAERSRRIELEERERLEERPRIVKGASR